MSEEIIDRIEDFVQSHKTVLYLFFINLVILLIFWGGLLHNQYNADTIFYRYQETSEAINMCLEEGRYLVVDELDSSIHFKLTRAIVALFNNELNTSAQMIFTVHDINLMDCKRMFRKEQIWFVHKDEEGVYVYSLADFTAQEGVRDTTDVMEKYRKGALGALPDPELIKSLLGIKGNAKGVIADAE